MRRDVLAQLEAVWLTAKEVLIGAIELIDLASAAGQFLLKSEASILVELDWHPMRACPRSKKSGGSAIPYVST